MRVLVASLGHLALGLQPAQLRAALDASGRVALMQSELPAVSTSPPSNSTLAEVEAAALTVEKDAVIVEEEVKGEATGKKNPIPGLVGLSILLSAFSWAIKVGGKKAAARAEAFRQGRITPLPGDEPPTCCFKFWCPSCAVASHEGCTKPIPLCLSCFCGCLYTNLAWTPSGSTPGDKMPMAAPNQQGMY